MMIMIVLGLEKYKDLNWLTNKKTYLLYYSKNGSQKNVLNPHLNNILFLKIRNKLVLKECFETQMNFNLLFVELIFWISKKSVVSQTPDLWMDWRIVCFFYPYIVYYRRCHASWSYTLFYISQHSFFRTEVDQTMCLS